MADESPIVTNKTGLVENKGPPTDRKGETAVFFLNKNHTRITAFGHNVKNTAETEPVANISYTSYSMQEAGI
jgi:hypothetical protein